MSKQSIKGVIIGIAILVVPLGIPMALAVAAYRRSRRNSTAEH